MTIASTIESAVDYLIASSMDVHACRWR